MDVRVVNTHALAGDPAPGVARVRIMRGTPLGNPFPMRDRSDAERDRVCQAYHGWLRQQWAAGGPAKTELLRLYGLATSGPLELVCCCAPKRCHGDTVKAALLGIAAARASKSAP